ncbi:MAG TPA: ATP-binding protein [Candidatus Eisenbacteria bacterium]|nr:ATP-binding protein [Candidatus Eisenbacteria bacterium]
MILRLKIYLILVGVAAVALLATHPLGDLQARGAHYVAWTAICLLSEMLWLSTLSGEGTVSMASTANLATLVLWGPDASMWIVSTSTLVAVLFVQKKPWIRAVFNASQSVVTMWLCGLVFVLLGGPRGGLETAGQVIAGAGGAASLVAPVLGLFVTYLLVNRALVAVAVAWSTERPYLRVLREDWFYRERLLDDLASFFLSPLMIVSYAAIGYVGVILFYSPLRMTYESQKRYVELRNAQNLLIHNERMAAKGEMAAEIGHELRNQLAAISGRAQMLLRDSEREAFASVPRHAQIILEQSKRMETLSKGLMDFSSAELRIERVDLNALTQRSMEFVRSQNKFDTIEWDLKLGPTVPELRADPGQIQQVLLNLFINAADAMLENGSTGRKVIAVTTTLDDRAREVSIVVSDTGPGIPVHHLTKVFEPHFTTKPEGHGFGLSTSYRIAANHGGSIAVDSPPGQGARFTLKLPLHGPGNWS